MENRRHYYSLDLLKFILATLIIFHHFQQITGCRFSHMNFYDGFMYFGYIVEMFFIISGFISYQKISEIERQSFSSYFKNIIYKLYPMIFITTITSLVAVIVYRLCNGFFLEGYSPDIFKVLNSFTLTFSGGAVILDRGMNNPLWYVCVLLICYIIFFVAIKISTKYKFPSLYIFVFICLFGLGIHEYGIKLPFMNRAVSRGYCAFFLGLMLAHAYNRISNKLLYISSYILLIINLIFAYFDYSFFFANEWGSLTFVVFPCVLFVFLSVEIILNKSICNLLGKISFEMYLWHFTLIVLLESIKPLLFPNYSYTALDMAIFTCFIILFAFTIHKTIEKPVNNMFSYLIHKSIKQK